MSELAIEARGLDRWHGERHAVVEVDLDVPAGARFGLVGENGAGKTTLMRMLGCTLTPHRGTLRVAGVDAVDDPRTVKSRIGVVPQGMTLDTELRVRENLVVHGRYFGMGLSSAVRRADELIELVSLEGHARDRADTLSGGMQRRLLIARALVARPRLLLLDEPTTGLDPVGRLLVWDQLGELSDLGVTMVVTSHYVEEIERLCTDLVVLDDGHVVRRGTPRSLVEDGVPARVVELVQLPVGSREVLGEAVGATVRTAGNRTLLFSDDSATARRLIARARVPEDRVVAERPSTLEDALIVAPWRDGVTLTDRTGASSGVRAAAPRRRIGLPSWRRAAPIWLRNATLFRRAYRSSPPCGRSVSPRPARGRR